MECTAPSAKMRRRVLGSLKAVKKASEAALAPRVAAMRISRMSPRQRLTMIHRLTVRM